MIFKISEQFCIKYYCYCCIYGCSLEMVHDRSMTGPCQALAYLKVMNGYISHSELLLSAGSRLD